MSITVTGMALLSDNLYRKMYKSLGADRHGCYLSRLMKNESGGKCFDITKNKIWYQDKFSVLPHTMNCRILIH